MTTNITTRATSRLQRAHLATKKVRERDWCSCCSSNLTRNNGCLRHHADWLDLTSDASGRALRQLCHLLRLLRREAPGAEGPAATLLPRDSHWLASSLFCSRLLLAQMTRPRRLPGPAASGEAEPGGGRAAAPPRAGRPRRRGGGGRAWEPARQLAWPSARRERQRPPGARARAASAAGRLARLRAGKSRAAGGGLAASGRAARAIHHQHAMMHWCMTSIKW